MMLTFTALPAFNDNYIWLIKNDVTRACAVVDPGDAQPVLNWLAEHPKWSLTDILITHHHADHTGGVMLLKQATQALVTGPATESIQGIERAATDKLQFKLLDAAEVTVIAVPGHTLGHVAYYSPATAMAKPWLLSGDTLFAAGCGRIFEGTAEQMFNSLKRLAALPDNTQVFCTHEYTLSNLKFAAAVEPNNPEISQRLHQVTNLRAAEQITLPSSIALEKATNPFLRATIPEVAQKIVQQGYSATHPVEVFAALRQWKDNF